jgi:glycerophosphoryl diester phosphodiesterase
MASAGAFALQVACLGRWSTPANAYGLATVELLTVAGLSLMATLPRGPSAPTGGATWAAVASTAAIATAGTFVVQSWAQSRLSTARANIVLTSEPLFAALAALAAGEVLSFWLLAGGALIVGAMVVASPGTRLASVLARRPVIAIAHRGDPMGQRENTLEAFASARALGADMVELDCRTTRDGQAVVVHDATLERLWGIPKAVSEVEWADLAHVRSAGWRVPLLEEVLASVDLPVMVDLPDPAAAQPAYQVVLRCGALQRCYFAGHTTGLCQVRQLSSAANIALTWDKQELPPAPLLATLRPQWWNPYHRLASPQTVEWAHAAGMGVSVWTVDRSGDVQKALAAGVDAVVSNRIRLLLDVLGRPGGTAKPAAG